MITDEIRARIKQAMKDGDTVTKDVLRVALGEIQTREADEAGAIAIVKKLVKSNEETAGLTPDGPAKDTLMKEITLLRSLLPASLGVDDIVKLLSEKAELLKGAKNDGAATGLAVKALKEQGQEADGKLVQEAVKRIRGA